MNRTLKICLVCIAWAAIGTQVALLLAATWWAVCLGLVCGSVGGYLTCGWRTVVWAIPHAWRRATSWRPDREYWLAVWYYSLSSTAISVTAFMLLGPFCLMVSTIDRGTSLGPDEPWIWAVSLLLLSFVLSLTAGFSAAQQLPSGEIARRDELAELRQIAVRFNFLGFWFWTAPRFCYRFWREHILPASRERVPKIPGVICPVVAKSLRLLGKVAVVSGRFLWNLYKLIHTEERWLVAVDIACGALVGVQFSSPIVGGLSGGTFWLANRLFIAGLWLKTLPARVR